MRPAVPSLSLLLLAALSCGLSAWPEWARAAANDSSAKAFSITGDRVTESADKVKITAIGHACARWGRIEVRADQIVADRLPGLPAAPPLKLSAKGHVTAKRKDVTLHGAELRFDAGRGTIEVTQVRGTCRLKDYELSLSANKVTFHLLAQKLTAAGAVSVQTPKGKASAERVEVDLRKSTLKVTKLRVRLRLK